MSDSAKNSPLTPTLYDKLTGYWGLDHIIENQEELKTMGASSKMNVQWEFSTRLRDLGRDTAASWLAANFDDVGQRATVDLQAMFAGIGGQHQG